MKHEPIALHILSGDLWAGKEYQVVALLSGAAELGQQLSVLLFNEGETAKRCRATGVNVSVVDERQGFLALISAAKKLPPPGVIFAHGYKEAVVGLLLSWKVRAKLVTVHHGRAEDLSAIFARLYHRLHLAVSRYFSAKVVFVSEELRDGLGFREDRRSVVIHNALLPLGDPSRIPENEANQIVIVGRVVGVKRIDLAIKAFEQAAPELLADVRLLIIGDGPDREALKKLADSSPVAERISFLGFRSDAVELIASARLLLITSDNEGVPTVLLEAMRVGVPVVTTAVGGIPEITRMFPDYSVVLVARGDVTALKLGITKFVASAAEAKAVEGAMSSRFSQYFSPKRVAEEYSKLITSLGENG